MILYLYEQPTNKAKVNIMNTKTHSPSRANILRSFIVITSNFPAEVETDGVDCVTVNSINYGYLKDYMELQKSFVWGLTLDSGGFYPVELTLPIRQDLDGWVAISKSHIMFDAEGITNPREFAKERLIEKLALTYPTPITQKSLTAAQTA